MIKSFAHKGLSEFYYTGSMRGIVPQHRRRLRLILATLDDEDVILVDYLDYH